MALGWDGEKRDSSPCLHIAIAPHTLMLRSFSLCLSAAETAMGSQSSSQYGGEISTLTYATKPFTFTLLAPCTAMGNPDTEVGWPHTLCSAEARQWG